jgi:two-component sensor histidine kinase
MLAIAAADGSVHGEHVRVRKDGSRLQADILVTAMRDDAGRLNGFSMVTHDITSRRDMEAALRDALAESQVLLRELHHRVRNNLQVISTVLYLQTMGMSDDELRFALRRTQQRVDALGLLFRNLLGPKRITSVGFTGYLGDLCTSLIRDFDPNLQFRREIPVETLALELDMAGPLGLLIGEILFTAADRAADGATSGTVVRVAPSADGILLRFDFDGGQPGTPPRIGGRHPLGAMVMEALANQVGTRLDLAGDEAGRVSVSLALPASLFADG